MKIEGRRPGEGRWGQDRIFVEGGDEFDQTTLHKNVIMKPIILRN
jgi:hypothetical protein